MSDTRPATDEEVAEMWKWKTAMPDGTPNGVGLMVRAVLARLAAAEEMCRDLQQSVDGMAHERLALETENAGLREALLDVAECSWCATRFTPGSGWPCEKCEAARRLLEAKP